MAWTEKEKEALKMALKEYFRRIISINRKKILTQGEDAGLNNAHRRVVDAAKNAEDCKEKIVVNDDCGIKHQVNLFSDCLGFINGINGRRQELKSLRLRYEEVRKQYDKILERVKSNVELISKTIGGKAYDSLSGIDNIRKCFNEYHEAVSDCSKGSISYFEKVKNAYEKVYNDVFNPRALFKYARKTVPYDDYTKLDTWCAQLIEDNWKMEKQYNSFKELNEKVETCINEWALIVDSWKKRVEKQYPPR